MTQVQNRRVDKGDARNRIIEAAEALANELGPGNISIEAVALRAGLSKGGVLYHFPTKTELLTALVNSHIERRKRAVDQHLASFPGQPNALAEALVEANRGESCSKPPASGVLAAIAAHPDLLEPLKSYHGEVLSRLKEESCDSELAMIAFLAIEGMKALHLFGFDLFDPREEDALLHRMTSLLRDERSLSAAAQAEPEA